MITRVTIENRGTRALDKVELNIAVLYKKCVHRFQQVGILHWIAVRPFPPILKPYVTVFRQRVDRIFRICMYDALLVAEMQPMNYHRIIDCHKFATLVGGGQQELSR